MNFNVEFLNQGPDAKSPVPAMERDPAYFDADHYDWMVP